MTQGKIKNTVKSMAILNAMAECDCTHSSGWWNRHFNLSPQGGMGAKLGRLVSHGMVKRVNVPNPVRGSKPRYVVHWGLTDFGQRAVDLGELPKQVASSLYGLLLSKCFSPESLKIRDDWSQEVELSSGWWRRRTRKHVV